MPPNAIPIWTCARSVATQDHDGQVDDMSDRGGSFAIAGFVYQFLNTIDRGLAASFAPGGKNSPILTLEPSFADAVEWTDEPRVIQYKTRTTRQWSNHAILFDVLPTLLRAALSGPGGDAQPVFVTSGTLQTGGALRSFLARLDTDEDPGSLRVGHTSLTHQQIVTRIVDAVRGESSAPGRVSEGRIRRLLSRVAIDEGVRTATVRHRTMAVLARATGSQRRAAAAYQALFTFIAELSADAATIVTAKQFLDAGGLSADVLAPIVEFDRRASDQVLATLRRRGYDEHRDVRGPLELPQATIVLIEAESGSGKTWSLAASAIKAIRSGELVVWLDRPTSLDDCHAQIVDQIWAQLLCRNDETNFHTLLADVAHVLQRENIPPLLVLIDQLPSSAAERDNLLEFDWGAAGMRLVAATSAEDAMGAQDVSAAPVVRIGNFSQTQLRDLLDRYDLSWSSIPSDARSWISQPMLAGLYVRLRSGIAIWTDNSEYELFDAFAERARQRGVANNVRGCRQLIATLGGQALGGGSLAPMAATPPATADQVDVLVRSGWLIYDSNDELRFAHGRLREWAVAEHLSRASQRPAELALTLAQLAGYRPDVEPQIPLAPYALMDTLWLIARAPDGPTRLAALLDAWDVDDIYWRIRDDLYRHLLATAGSQFLDALLPALVARLSASPESDRQSDAIACVKGFADARQGSPMAISRLLADSSRSAQRCACLLIAALPDPARLDALALIHCQSAVQQEQPDHDDSLLSEAAWAAIRSCALIAPSWAPTYFDREIDRDPGPGHLISLLTHLPDGQAIWEKHGEALVGRYAAKLDIRYWLASCIGAFDDRRFDDHLSAWCVDRNGMAALPAWGAVCRWRPDLAETLAGKLPPGLFNFNSDSWITQLLKPGHEKALAAVVAAIRAADPSGCELGFTFSGRAQALTDGDIAWAASRLSEALVPTERQDLVATRLLDFFAAITDPRLVERLPTLIPTEVAPRLIALARRRIAQGGLWHDSDLAAAETLLRYLGPETSAEVLRMQLSQSHPTRRWNAVRDAGFAELSAIRAELEAIAFPDHRGEEPGRYQAVKMLADRDPEWGRAHIRQLLARGTAPDFNDAFWLARRIPGDDFVPDAVARIPMIFADAQTLYRLPDYLLSRTAGLAQLSAELIPALASRPADADWIRRVLVAVNQPDADAALLASVSANPERLQRAEFGFWGTVRRQDQPAWAALAADAVATIPARSLRHLPWFYQYAARQTGPAHDQLLSDAYPVDPAQNQRALNAIGAIAAVDPDLARDALASLCRLVTSETTELPKLAEALSTGTFQDGRKTIFQNAIHWPTKELLLALTPDGRPWEESLVAEIEAAASSPDVDRRRAACACLPVVLGHAPTPDMLNDASRAVRKTAQKALTMHNKRRRALLLLDTMRSGPPPRSRQAAAILVAMVKHAKDVHEGSVFSRAEFLAAVPSGSGLLWAYPQS